MQNKNDLLKQIPHMDKLLQNKLITGCEAYRHEITDAVRDVLAELRVSLISGGTDSVPCDDVIVQSAIELLTKRRHKHIHRVINGTGVILHSNLGRACLSKAAAYAVVEAASSYCTLEYDIEKGERGNRTGGIEKLLVDITGCEASLIVNNNAAAVLLVLSALAGGGNIIVSRGELVEIGGGFRIPEIISLCGCTLKEVGTTNKTRISDYEAAIDGETKALLKVHSSNFSIVGFTESVTVKELAVLGKSRGLPVIEDIGSGALADVKRYGISGEPFADESLKDGADVVTFSGDKLLGGLQCGIILGSKEFIGVIKKHPMYRAFRVDKMTIAALEATLRVYKDPRAAERDIPVLAMLALTEDDLRSRAESLCGQIRQRSGAAEVLSTKSVAGGGAVPGLELNTSAIAPISKESAESLEQQLRALPVPIIGRIENNRLLLDVRTVFEEDFDYIANAIAEITGKPVTS